MKDNPASSREAYQVSVLQNSIFLPSWYSPSLGTSFDACSEFSTCVALPGKACRYWHIIVVDKHCGAHNQASMHSWNAYLPHSALRVRPGVGRIPCPEPPIGGYKTILNIIGYEPGVIPGVTKRLKWQFGHSFGIEKV